jgi:hypothetical protein
MSGFGICAVRAYLRRAAPTSEALKLQRLLGFGTFRMLEGGCQPVVESAIALGYRHCSVAKG